MADALYMIEERFQHGKVVLGWGVETFTCFRYL